MAHRRLALALVLALAPLAACERPGPKLPLSELYSPPEGRFVHVSSTDPKGHNHDYLEIPAGDSATLLDLPGPGIVRRLWVTVASSDPDYLRRIALEMYWDGELSPSVEAPLGDFFGDGFAKKHYTALVMGESSGGFYCYLPMPFARHARIVVVNGTGRRIDAFYYNIDVVTGVVLPRNVETLHAWWHRDPRTTSKSPFLIVDARGSGSFVGLTFDVQSAARNFSFLEGNEIYTVDGQRRGEGTGTEDFFNSGWYFDEGTFAGPYHGLLIKNDTLGRIAAYRWFLADRIPFHRSFRLQIEHGAENGEVADYATTAFWYQTEPHARLPALPPPDERRVRPVAIPVSAVMVDSLRPRRRGTSTVLAVPVPRPDRYTPVLYPSWDDPGPLTPVVRPAVAARDSLRVTVTGRLPEAVEARPVREWASAWNVAGPFPSPPAAGRDSSPALGHDFGPERDPDLRASYTGLGGARVRWRRAAAGADGRVDLTRLFKPGDWMLAYGEAFLFSPTARAATLLLGADDGDALWVNGVKVSERQGEHISLPDDVAVPVALKRGWNRVLIKVANLTGGWAFQLRAADPDGVLRWSAVPR